MNRRLQLGLLATAVIFGRTAHAQPEPLALKLTCPGAVRVGQEATCTLWIEGVETREIFEGTPGFRWDMKPVKGFPSGFQQTFQLLLKQPGQTKIGPYKVDFQGKHLVSNEATILVMKEQDDSSAKSNVVLTKSAISLGETTNVVLEYVTSSAPQSPFSVTFEPNLGATPTGSRSSLKFANGKKLSVSAYFYTITPKKAGRFKLSRETIKGLPSDMSFEEQSLEVK